MIMTPKQEAKRQKQLAAAHKDYNRGLNKYAFFKLSNHDMGEDLVQETFLKTWKYLVKGGKIDIMKAFLYHVLNNLIVDQYRKRKTTSLDVLIEKGFEPSVDDEGQFMNVLDGRNALLLIALLPKKYQKVMRMRYVENLLIPEIKIITGQSENAIAVQIHRGIKKLRVLHEQGIRLLDKK